MSVTTHYGATCQNKNPKDLNDQELEAEIKNVSAATMVMYTMADNERTPKLDTYSVLTAINLDPLLDELEQRAPLSGPQRPSDKLSELNKIIHGAPQLDGKRNDYHVAVAIIQNEGVNEKRIYKGMRPVYAPANG